MGTRDEESPRCVHLTRRVTASLQAFPRAIQDESSVGIQRPAAGKHIRRGNVWRQQSDTRLLAERGVKGQQTLGHYAYDFSRTIQLFSILIFAFET